VSDSKHSAVAMGTGIRRCSGPRSSRNIVVVVLLCVMPLLVWMCLCLLTLLLLPPIMLMVGSTVTDGELTSIMEQCRVARDAITWVIRAGLALFTAHLHSIDGIDGHTSFTAHLRAINGVAVAAVSIEVALSIIVITPSHVAPMEICLWISSGLTAMGTVNIADGEPVFDCPPWSRSF
jgi:hypothetical protein